MAGFHAQNGLAVTSVLASNGSDGSLPSVVVLEGRGERHNVSDLHLMISGEVRILVIDDDPLSVEDLNSTSGFENSVRQIRPNELEELYDEFIVVARLQRSLRAKGPISGAGVAYSELATSTDDGYPAVSATSGVERNLIAIVIDPGDAKINFVGVPVEQMAKIDFERWPAPVRESAVFPIRVRVFHESKSEGF